MVCTRFFASLLLLLFLSSYSYAQIFTAQNQFTFEGTLVDNNNNPVNLQSVQIDFKISNAANTCVIYSETSTTAGDSNGVISHRVGNGSIIVNSINLFTPSLFSSTVSGSATGQISATCTLLNGEERYLRISVPTLPGLTISMPLTAVPYALSAQNAQNALSAQNTNQVSGYNFNIFSPATGSILQYDGANFTNITMPTCSAGMFLRYTGSSYICDTPAAGTGTVTNVIGSTDISVTTPSTIPTLSINTSNSANQLLRLDSGAKIPSSLLPNSGVGAGTYSKVTVDAFGRVTNGSNITSTDITTALGYTPAQTISFLTGQSGSAFNISQAGNTYTFNIPMANTNSVAGGLISKSEYDSFNSKVSSITAGTGITVTGSTIPTIGLSNSGVTAGTYSKLQVDSFGRVISATTIAASDITSALQTGKLGVGTTTPDARLHIAQGTTSTAPIKLTTGSLVTTPQNGAIEYDGTSLYATNNVGIRRNILMHDNGILSSISNISPVSGSMSVVGNTTFNGTTFFVKNAGSGEAIFEQEVKINDNLTVSNSVIVSQTINAFHLRLKPDDNISQNCSPSDEGKQRYNNNLKTMEYCDGTFWQGVNGVTHCTSPVSGIGAGVSYTLIGKPGTPLAFCMNRNIEAATQYSTALNNCISRNTTIGSRPYLCSIEQLDRACKQYNDVNQNELTMPSLRNTVMWTSNVYAVSGVSGTVIFTSINNTNTTNVCDVTNKTINAAHDNATVNLNYRCCYQ